jgi:hypothetical protein
MGDFMTNYGILLTYILLAVATFTALGFPIKYLIENPKKSKDVGKGAVALLVVYLIAYFMASDEVTDHFSKFNVSPAESKQVGAGLFVFYILAAGAILSAVYTEVSKLRK